MALLALNPTPSTRQRRKRPPRRKLNAAVPLWSRGRLVYLEPGKRNIHALREMRYERPLDAPEPYPIDPDVVDPGRTREQEWLRDHGTQFAGKWVALFGASLISHGETASEVLAAARAQGFARPLLVHVTEEPELPFGGW
jgi:hypothetical protein